MHRPDVSQRLRAAAAVRGRDPGLHPPPAGTADRLDALLRTEAGRDPHDRALSDLIGELATRSEPFRARWAAHNVRLHRTGVKHFHPPVIGALELAFDAMELPAETGLTFTAYTAEPGTSSEDGLRLLASWAATLEHEAQTSQAVTPVQDVKRGHAPERPAP